MRCRHGTWARECVTQVALQLRKVGGGGAEVPALAALGRDDTEGESGAVPYTVIVGLDPTIHPLTFPRPRAVYGCSGQARA